MRGTALAIGRGSFKIRIARDYKAWLFQTMVTLRGEIRAGDEETRTLMRVLHEEVIGRMAVLGEARKSRKRTP